MQLTSKQIIKTARQKVLELSSDVVSDEAAYLALNLGYQDLQMKSFTKSKIVTKTITLTGDETDLPSNYRSLAGKPKDAQGRVVEVYGFEDFSRLGTSDRGINIRDRKVYSNGSSSIGSISIGYYSFFDELTITQDPEVDDYLHECLIYATMYRIYEDLQDEEMAILTKNKYTAMLDERMNTISQNEENIQETSMFNGIRII